MRVVRAVLPRGHTGRGRECLRRIQQPAETRETDAHHCVRVGRGVRVGRVVRVGRAVKDGKE